MDEPQPGRMGRRGTEVHRVVARALSYELPLSALWTPARI